MIGSHVPARFTDDARKCDGIAFVRGDRCELDLRWRRSLRAVTLASGCSLLATAMYVIEGTNTKADFAGLKGKTRGRGLPAGHFAALPRFERLARPGQAGRHAAGEATSPRSTIIDQRDVFEWADENNWEEYVEIGKALNADMVVGLDLEEFSLYQGQTLYQGKANMKILVYDVAKGKRAGVRAELAAGRLSAERGHSGRREARAAVPPPVRRSTWRSRSPTTSTTTTRRSTSPATARRC